MAVDGGYGPRGGPLFDPDGAVDDAFDFGAVGKYAEKVGNRMAGTRAERLALVSTNGVENRYWNGLEFEQLDGTDAGLWKVVAGSWVRYKPVDFTYVQDGELPENTPAIPAILGAHELIVQIVRYRFITTAQAEIGASWSPYRNWPKPFPNGLMSIQATPRLLSSFPTTPNPIVSHANATQFRLHYPGSVAVTQRAVEVVGFGF